MELAVIVQQWGTRLDADEERTEHSQDQEPFAQFQR